MQRRFRERLREAHPDHGAEIDGAAQRIADLTEARRILLGSSWRAPGALLLAPGAGAAGPTLRSSRSRRRSLRCRSSASTSRTAAPAARRPTAQPSCWRASATRLPRWSSGRGIRPDRLVLGGRSMGGRMCSMAVADGLPAAGLVLICYPLHPPGQPAKLRVDHFPDLDRAVPVRLRDAGPLRRTPTSSSCTRRPSRDP